MNKFISVVLSLVLICLCLMPSVFAKNNEEAIVDEGFVNIEDFGARGSDDKDDTAAFEKALATGKNLYLPKGNFYVSKTIVLSDRILCGSSPSKTRIFGIIADKTSPIILMDGVSSLYDIVIGYKTKSECNGAKQGEKVAIQIGSNNKPLEAGSVVKSIYLLYNGTSVYCPEDSGCNRVMFENIEIKHFTYRGFDMQAKNRMLNSYSNCYITSHSQTEPECKVDCGFALEGSSYCESLNQVNVEHDEYNYAVILKNAQGINVSSMHLEGVCLRTKDAGYVFVENTSGYIASICTMYTRVMQKNNYLFYFGDSQSSDVLEIDLVQCRGLNGFDKIAHPLWDKDRITKGLDRGLLDGSAEAKTFRLFGRKANAIGKYTVNVGYNSYLSYLNGKENDDTALYRTYESTKNFDVNVEID